MDLHRALTVTRLGERHLEGCRFVLVVLQEGKDDVAHSLHASGDPVSRRFLGHLGFREYKCQFTLEGLCLARSLGPGIDLDAFGDAFSQGLSSFREAVSNLDLTGFVSPIPAGFDGHRGQATEFVRGVDEGVFRFALSWVVAPQAAGWVTHVHLRSPAPYDAERFLADIVKLRRFASCPHFDFGSCHWVFTSRGQQLDPVADQLVHSNFERLPWKFPRGLAALAAAESAMESVGMDFRRPLDLISKPSRLKPASGGSKKDTRRAAPPMTPGDQGFDVALSFAGSERHLAEEFAGILKGEGVKIFYDKDHPDKLWGENLTVELDAIYGERSRFFVPFVSHEYVRRDWPQLELRSARARALRERSAFILPIRVDQGAQLKGVPETIGYLSLEEYTLEQIAEVLRKKLGAVFPVAGQIRR